VVALEREMEDGVSTTTECDLWFQREREREREREGKSKETAPRRLPNFLSFFFLVLEIDKASWIIFLFYNIYIHI
jgi:hypothetical protein